jgi:hypothetical protein
VIDTLDAYYDPVENHIVISERKRYKYIDGILCMMVEVPEWLGGGYRKCWPYRRIE